MEEEDEDTIEIEREQKKKANPGNESTYKVIVTNENGLQASDPNRLTVARLYSDISTLLLWSFSLSQFDTYPALHFLWRML